MGTSRSNCQKVAPPNSFIHVQDFTSPENLAKYLLELASNKTKYLQYFAWKSQGYITSSSSLWCKLCAQLHQPQAETWYADIGQWWAHDGVCDQPDFSDFNIDVAIPNLLIKKNRLK